MVRVYEQVDVAAIDGSIGACSSSAAAQGEYNREVQESGTLGSGTNVMTANTTADERGFHFESEANEPNETSWPVGDWTARINVTTGNANVDWEHWLVCRLNSSGVDQGSIVLALPININLTAGVKSDTREGLADTALADDRFYFIGVINRVGGHGNQSVTVTNNQVLDTPFAAPASPTATSAMTMLLPTMAATGAAAHQGTSAMTMLIPTMVAAGVAAHQGTSAMVMLLPTMVSSGVANAVIGTSAMTMLLPTMAASGVAAHQGTSAMTIPVPTMAAAGKLGHFGASAMVIPLPTMVASGAAAHVGTSAMVMLIPTMVATGVRAGGAAVTVCTGGVWSSAVSFLACDDYRITIDGPAADQVKVSATLEFEE